MLWKPTLHPKGEGHAVRGLTQPDLVGSTGVMTMARDKGNSQATREIRRGDRAERSTGGSREPGLVVAEVGEVHSTDEAG